MRYTPLEHLHYLEELKLIITPEDNRDIDQEIADMKRSIEQDEQFKEKCRTYTPPEYVPRDEEDETPQPGDDILGEQMQTWRDDARITGYQGI